MRRKTDELTVTKHLKISYRMKYTLQAFGFAAGRGIATEFVHNLALILPVCRQETRLHIVPFEIDQEPKIWDVKPKILRADSEFVSRLAWQRGLTEDEQMRQLV
ncbi:MAG: hypothetical protein HY397_03540 [Candidatus Doudnabacteria bacterium]|nr:hypothetical protein [Candidatus Doudnabacteria bacterium]